MREPWFPTPDVDTLVIEVAVIGFNVEGIQDAADEWNEGDTGHS